MKQKFLITLVFILYFKTIFNNQTNNVTIENLQTYFSRYNINQLINLLLEANELNKESNYIFTLDNISELILNFSKEEIINALSNIVYKNPTLLYKGYLEKKAKINLHYTSTGLYDFLNYYSKDDLKILLIRIIKVNNILNSKKHVDNNYIYTNFEYKKQYIDFILSIINGNNYLTNSIVLDDLYLFEVLELNDFKNYLKNKDKSTLIIYALICEKYDKDVNNLKYSKEIADFIWSLTLENIVNYIIDKSKIYPLLSSSNYLENRIIRFQEKNLNESFTSGVSSYIYTLKEAELVLIYKSLKNIHDIGFYFNNNLYFESLHILNKVEVLNSYLKYLPTHVDIENYTKLYPKGLSNYLNIIDVNYLKDLYCSYELNYTNNNIINISLNANKLSKDNIIKYLEEKADKNHSLFFNNSFDNIYNSKGGCNKIDNYIQ